MIDKILNGKLLKPTDRFGFKALAADVYDVRHVLYETAEFSAAAKNSGYAAEDLKCFQIQHETSSYVDDAGYIHREVYLFELFNHASEVKTRPTLSLEAAISMTDEELKEPVENALSLAWAVTHGTFTALKDPKTGKAEAFMRGMAISQCFSTEKSVQSEKAAAFLKTFTRDLPDGPDSLSDLTDPTSVSPN